MGPLFFGAAEKAMSVLQSVDRTARVVVLDLRSVPTIDATGLANLELTLARLRESGMRVVLAGVQSQPRRALARAGWPQDAADLAIESDFDAAIDTLAAGRSQAGFSDRP